jgi:hypothetical protein
MDLYSGLLILSGLIGAGIVLIQGALHYRLRVLAWPSRLEDLRKPPPRSPAARLLLGGLVVLSLASSIKGSSGAEGATAISSWAAFAAGALLAWACLMAAHWCYNTWLLIGGMAMVALCLAGLTMGVAVELGLEESARSRTHSAAIVSLSFSSWLWMWLDRVWRQQLSEDGAAFTTTGHMVGLAAKFGGAVSILATIAVCSVLYSHADAADPSGSPAIACVESIAWVLFWALGPLREKGVGWKILSACELAAVGASFLL